MRFPLVVFRMLASGIDVPQEPVSQSDIFIHAVRKRGAYSALAMRGLDLEFLRLHSS
jgi:hypothetical protein